MPIACGKKRQGQVALDWGSLQSLRVLTHHHIASWNLWQQLSDASDTFWGLHWNLTAGGRSQWYAGVSVHFMAILGKICAHGQCAIAITESFRLV